MSEAFVEECCVGRGVMRDRGISLGLVFMICSAAGLLGGLLILQVRLRPEAVKTMVSDVCRQLGRVLIWSARARPRFGTGRHVCPVGKRRHVAALQIKARLEITWSGSQIKI